MRYRDSLFVSDNSQKLCQKKITHVLKGLFVCEVNGKMLIMCICKKDGK